MSYYTTNINFKQFTPAQSQLAGYIEEYKAAASEVDTEQKLFTHMTIILTIIASMLHYVIKYLDELVRSYAVLDKFSIYIHYTSICIIFFCIIYFAKKTNSIVYSKRKLVIIRGLLKINYGIFGSAICENEYQFSSNPFFIKKFRGIFSYEFFPIAILLGMNLLIIILLCRTCILINSPLPFNIHTNLYILSSSVTLIFYATYRYFIFENFESFLRIFTLGLAQILRIRINRSLEYSIYCSEMAVNELERIKVSVQNIERFIVFLEDKRFYSHYRFFFYSDEGGEPAHIHVEEGDKVAKFWLHDATLARARHFKGHELTVLRKLVVQHRAVFLEVWNEFFTRPL